MIYLHILVYSTDIHIFRDSASKYLRDAGEKHGVVHINISMYLVVDIFQCRFQLGTKRQDKYLKLLYQGQMLDQARLGDAI